MNRFDNQPIQRIVDGENRYVDWAENIQAARHFTRDLQEALLHCDPDKARKSLSDLETAIAGIRHYLELRAVVSPVYFESEHEAPDADLGVIAERVADAFQKVANEMPVEGAIRALCPSHLRARGAGADLGFDPEDDHTGAKWCSSCDYTVDPDCPTCS